MPIRWMTVSNTPPGFQLIPKDDGKWDAYRGGMPFGVFDSEEEAREACENPPMTEEPPEPEEPPQTAPEAKKPASEPAKPAARHTTHHAPPHKGARR